MSQILVTNSSQPAGFTASPLFATRAALVALAMMVSGCSYMGVESSAEDYLEAASIERVKVPDTLDQPQFNDALIIPPVDDVRGISGKPLKVGLPAALTTAFGVEQIVIRKLGDDRWIFIDTPPAAVWPKIRLFWAVKNMDVQFADPRLGVIETDWLSSAAGSPAVVYDSLTSGVAWADAGASVQNKFRLSVEAGIRGGSTEVKLEHKQVPLGVPVRADVTDWNGKSDDEELEGKLMSELAYFLAETIPQGYSISRGAMNIASSRVEILPDPERPVLRYKLDFDRAWSTVASALEDARITIDDLDRTGANYFVYYDDAAYQEPGLLSRLFNRDERVAGEANKYLLHMEDLDDGVHVTVLKDANTVANAFVAERLLKIIKEHST